MTPPQKAATLMAKAAIGKARLTSHLALQAHQPANHHTLRHHMTDTPQPIKGTLFRQFALGEDGQPLPMTTPEEIVFAEGAPTEWITMGNLQFVVVDAAPQELAIATGATTEDGPPVLCLRVRFDPTPDLLQPAMCDMVVVQAEDASLSFRVQWTHEDAQAPNPFAQPGEVWTTRNPALDTLQADEALLVQIADPTELEAA